MKNGLTYIQVSKDVAKRLKKIRVIDRESYNSVIERLCKNFEEQMK